MKMLLIFYTAEPKPPEIFNLDHKDELTQFLDRIRELSKHRAKFCVYKVGEMIGDYS